MPHEQENSCNAIDTMFVDSIVHVGNVSANFNSDDKATSDNVLDDSCITLPAVTIHCDATLNGASTSTPVTKSTTNTDKKNASQSNSMNTSLAAACPSISKKHGTMLQGRSNNETQQISVNKKKTHNISKLNTYSQNFQKSGAESTELDKSVDPMINYNDTPKSTGLHDKSIFISPMDINSLSSSPIPTLLSETSSISPSTNTNNTNTRTTNITTNNTSDSNGITKSINSLGKDIANISTHIPSNSIDYNKHPSYITTDNSNDVHLNLLLSQVNTINDNIPKTTNNTNSTAKPIHNSVTKPDTIITNIPTAINSTVSPTIQTIQHDTKTDYYKSANNNIPSNKPNSSNTK